MVLNIAWVGNGNNEKPLKWVIIDSLIIAGIAFVSLLPSDRLPSVWDLYVALRAFLYAFLVQTAVELGIKPALDRRVRKNGYKGG